MQVFITGANRGIGLELARGYATEGATVYATARNPEDVTELQSVAGDVTVVQLDVTDSDSIAAAYETVSRHTGSLDILINNAGKMKRPGNLTTMTVEESIEMMHVNAIGPVFVTRTFAPLLRAGDTTKLVNISSQLGSLSRKRDAGLLDYCASKAALNMFTRGLAAEFKSDGVITITVHPGWVQTDMGGAAADITPTASAEGIMRVIRGLTPNDNGAFLRWDGTLHPW